MRGFLVLAIGLLWSFATAQAPLFQRITERDGLVFREVHDICFDDRGMLWIGTAMGLSRYDGSGFRTYSTGDGLPAPRVYDIEVDSTGVLWLATPNGLASLDPRTDVVKTWQMDTSANALARSNRLNSVQPLVNGIVLCGADNNTFRVDTRTGKVRPLGDLGEGTVLVNNRCMLADSAGMGTWFATTTMGLSYYDAVRDTVFWRGNDPTKHPMLNGLPVSNLVKDANGTVWMDDIRDGGVHVYRPRNKLLEHWPHIPGHPELRYPNGMLSMLIDPLGRLWIGDWVGNPMIFDPRNDQAIPLPYTTSDPAALVDRSITSMALNERGQIWLGTLNGLSAYDPDRSTFQHISSKDLFQGRSVFLSTIAEDEQGRVWVGSDTGLVRLDPQGTPALYLQVVQDGKLQSVSDLVHGSGALWAGCTGGLFRIDTGTEQVTRLEDPRAPDMNTGFAAALAIDRLGRIWSARNRGRIHRYDPTQDTHHVFFNDSSLAGGPPPGNINDVLCASDGTIWLAHETDGLVRMDPETGACTTNLSDVRAGVVAGRRILTLAEDLTGRIWYMADGVGLVRYDPAQKKYTTYTAEHGLPIPAGSGILVDSRGQLWIGLLNGLVRFDPDQERFIRLDIERGQHYNDVGHGALLARNGEIWITNQNDLMHFDRSQIQDRTPPTKPLIHALFSYGTRLQIPEAGPLVLDHEHDQLLFRFASFDLPGRIVRYAFREVSDGRWNEGREGQVTLGQLKPGSYHYQVRTMADDGQWSDTADLFIIMEPPWWQRFGARVTFAVLLAVAIVLLFRLRLNLIRKKERRQEALARTVNELKLRALRAQMDPHFIFNCLNSIDKYIVMEQSEEASRYLNKFARLIRLILNQSDHVTVSLDKEVELLRYYLELEALRFENPFSFTVSMDPMLEREEPELPAMLVQPYVENAIWHGLQHKQGSGHIRVEFRKLADTMVVTVEDDGVGRAEAGRIKAMRTTLHSSKGMQVNADRMKLMEDLSRSGTTVYIEDLIDRSGTPLGTRVTITLPLEALQKENWAEQELA